MNMAPLYGLIATYNRTDLLDRTLSSLAEAELPNCLARIIIAENGSNSAEPICAKYKDRLPIDYKYHPEPGKFRALQKEIDQIGSGFVVFLDDDVRVSPQLLMAYEQAMNRGRGCLYGGPIGVDYESTPPSAWLRPYLPPSAVGCRGVEGPSFVDGVEGTYFLGANMAAYVEDILEFGGFNRDLGPGALVAGTEGNPTGGEAYMVDLMLANGYEPVWIPDAVVWHWVPDSRCSPQWVVNRYWRGGLQEGTSRPTPPGRSFRGVPLWLWRQRAVRSAQARLKRFGPWSESRFHAERRYAHTCGLIQGLRQKYTGNTDSLDG